jgi:hypothetical protein
MPDLDAILAGMRERAGQITGDHDEGDDRDLDGDTCTGHDAERLIDVVEAVLRLAGDWKAPRVRPRTSEEIIRFACAMKLAALIERELTRKDGADE